MMMLVNSIFFLLKGGYEVYGCLLLKGSELKVQDLGFMAQGFIVFVGFRMSHAMHEVHHTPYPALDP